MNNVCYKLIISLVKFNIAIKSRSVHDVNHLGEVTRYMRAMECVVIEEVIEYWIPENTSEIDRKWHNFKLCIKDSNRKYKKKERRWRGGSYIIREFEKGFRISRPRVD